MKRGEQGGNCEDLKKSAKVSPSILSTNNLTPIGPFSETGCDVKVVII